MAAKPKLIALYSPVMQSGKSEVAAHLARKHGFQIVSFARPLKLMTAALIEAAGHHAYEAERYVWGDLKDAEVPGLGTTSRRLQQTLGTEWGRNTINKDLWVNVGLAKAQSRMGHGFNVVIDDMRFPNEYDAVVRAGGQVWSVERPGAPAPSTDHPSEGLLSGRVFDYHLNNSGSLEDLRELTTRLFSVKS